jgi:hypothetical protein
MAKIARLMLAAFLPVAAVGQQTLVMRDGSRLDGRMTGASDNTITFRDRDGGVHTLDFSRVDAIQFGHDAAREGENAGPPPSGNNYGTDNRGYNAPGPQNSGVITLPAGTALSVRSNEAINTQNTTESRSYGAQVSQDVVDPGGNVAIPRGSGARLIVRRLSDGVLALDLQSISVNGRRYLVDTGSAPQGQRGDGIGENKRTAEFAGGGAVIGTLLGAIAGGGKGAAIGALAGGAVGVGTEVATRGPIIRVPAETVLNFRLDNALSLRPAQ